MTEDERPQQGDFRFAETGDLEVYDNGEWKPVASMMHDEGIRRDDPPGTPKAAEAAEGDDAGEG